jgi:metal-dependent amidase/aminoacylase/carboxypeptidase family protein
VPNAGGKIHMIRAGHFDNLDAAIMIHPMTEDRIDYDSSLVARNLELTFRGKSAHAAANPHEGVNALDALIVMFSSGCSASRFGAMPVSMGLSPMAVLLPTSFPP